MKLNDQFAMVRENFPMMVPLPDLTQVFRMIAQEESHKDYNQTSNQGDNLVFIADKRKFQSQSSQYQTPGNSQRQGFNGSKKTNQKKKSLFLNTLQDSRA